MQISFELQPLLNIFETMRIDRMNIPRVIVECDFSYSFRCDDRSIMIMMMIIMMILRCIYYLFEDGTRTIRVEDFYGNLCSLR